MLVLLSGITKTILLYNCIATIFTFIFYKPNTMFCETDSKKNHITWIFLPHYSGTTQKEERDSSLIKNVIITERSIINRSTAATHTETSSKVIVQSHIMVWGGGTVFDTKTKTLQSLKMTHHHKTHERARVSKTHLIMRIPHETAVYASFSTRSAIVFVPKFSLHSLDWVTKGI